MKKTQLSKAIAFALTGAALSFGAVSTASAASTTMYNLSSTGGFSSAGTINPTLGGVWKASYYGNTDGWTNGDSPFTNIGGAAVKSWAGTASATTAAFGYTGSHLNWGAEFTGGLSNTATISTFDAFNKYGKYADIDTAKGAWSDNALDGASGWRHDLELGLFKTDTAGTVTLNVTGLLQSGTDFGFTIFKGMDTVTDYNHHGAWNADNNVSGIDADKSNPYSIEVAPGIYFPMTGALSSTDIVAYSVGGATPSNLNTISFNAEAGQIYSIFLGGYRNGDWGTTTDGYSLSISQASPVPVPGAAWLFGGAIASLIGANRRKRVVPA
ncbi:hypothetical protein A1359_00330 [Methylomonas lenta]|uniref:PEP-CTERM sorting domain-containing protein n=1 Tax=Methylomonas lenta TaxID=980561 RepID=A0A177NG22_9GAMM|nr:hypothetical protein [Methylomonas lenta]OAI17038.1 hypothetical protein A1359_00330 [Methylomonas lenta]